MKKDEILLYCSDLMFSSRIKEAAKQAGITVKSCRSISKLEERKSESISRYIVDLNFAKDEIGNIVNIVEDVDSIIGYYSHVDVELKSLANSNGINNTFIRSQFVKNLNSILLMNT